MTSESAAKKDIQKLQRAIVDGLEDVKGQDIVVFNTEELSPLFERVIVASGTSNRQTKALAASVRDAVREAGFDKPRIEGEDNGEWIIVDCGPAVAHVMQPAIRQYYRLEDIWGAKPVRLTTAAAKKAEAAKKKARPAADKVAEAKPVSAKAVVRKAAAKAAPGKAPASKKAAAKKPAAKTAPAKPRAGMSKVVVNAPAAKKKASPKAAPAAKKPARPAAKKKA
ncbi:MAG: ribosome silencing factor [Hydrogenophaga sp.]|uniref:ribosome silencing factor n=1 Tax=Hydrogenophaga sp. TaxID=1904254 RepID=UPI0016B51E21|nr:ribosome silencing factor [Hydrogenophaga sp.]NIM41146.1 ribosome silencing factor [Hydrogenophaga sp.]NIN26462.1 ribosome silencing factor [Hydrogenophaga sp.]NIN31337.1 ribosome silencing factor [Hydrogenophaga sp.]NIN55392.1 ribosome silencing factor [Hydrogenophaga sp.]NIO51727.1 ribosome silencing factor [Hydrogenophaga sp.]